MLKLKQNLQRRFTNHNQRKDKVCRSQTPTTTNARNSNSITIDDKRSGDDRYSVSPSNCSCDDIDKRLAKAVRKEKVKKQMKNLQQDARKSSDRIAKRNVMSIKKQANFMRTQEKFNNQFDQPTVFTIKLKQVKKTVMGKKARDNQYEDKENTLIRTKDSKTSMS